MTTDIEMCDIKPSNNTHGSSGTAKIGPNRFSKITLHILYNIMSYLPQNDQRTLTQVNRFKYQELTPIFWKNKFKTYFPEIFFSLTTQMPITITTTASPPIDYQRDFNLEKQKRLKGLGVRSKILFNCVFEDDFERLKNQNVTVEDFHIVDNAKRDLEFYANLDKQQHTLDFFYKIILPHFETNNHAIDYNKFVNKFRIFHWMIRFNQYNQIVIFLSFAENHSQIDDCTNGMTALILAACGNNLKIIELLVEKGANINAVSIKRGVTPRIMAAQHGHFQIVKFLAATEASINADPTRNSATDPTSVKNKNTQNHQKCMSSLKNASQWAKENPQYPVELCAFVLACGEINQYPLNDYSLRIVICFIAAINSEMIDKFIFTQLYQKPVLLTLQSYNNKWFIKHGERARSLITACENADNKKSLTALIATQIGFFENPRAVTKADEKKPKHERPLTNNIREEFHQSLQKAMIRLG